MAAHQELLKQIVQTLRTDEQSFIFYQDLITRCTIPGGTTAPGCERWVGKAHNAQPRIMHPSLAPQFGVSCIHLRWMLTYQLVEFPPNFWLYRLCDTDKCIAVGHHAMSSPGLGRSVGAWRNLLKLTLPKYKSTDGVLRLAIVRDDYLIQRREQGTKNPTRPDLSVRVCKDLIVISRRLASLENYMNSQLREIQEALTSLTQEEREETVNGVQALPSFPEFPL